LECLGSGAVSNPVEDVKLAEVVIIIGSNPTVNHPVGATFMKNATKTGTKIILIDYAVKYPYPRESLMLWMLHTLLRPRARYLQLFRKLVRLIDPNRTAIAKYASHHLAFRPDTDVAMLNGIMHVILDEGLQNDDYIKKHTEDFEFMKEQSDQSLRLRQLNNENYRCHEYAVKYPYPRESLMLWMLHTLLRPRARYLQLFRKSMQYWIMKYSACLSRVKTLLCQIQTRTMYVKHSLTCNT
jgi:anaerobic selenocysteine-containing dehydrogenase